MRNNTIVKKLKKKSYKCYFHFGHRENEFGDPFIIRKCKAEATHRVVKKIAKRIQLDCDVFVT